jgi:hypothetical protein
VSILQRFAAFSAGFESTPANRTVHLKPIEALPDE